jgi:endogenous inhibitor of DNA gyrase (YacG/DUF329 family)
MPNPGSNIDPNSEAAPVNSEPGTQAGPGEWLASWEQVESIARDASKFFDKCGDQCRVSDLAEWRERVIAQVQRALAEEQEVFERIQAQHGAEDNLEPGYKQNTDGVWPSQAAGQVR